MEGVLYNAHYDYYYFKIKTSVELLFTVFSATFRGLRVLDFQISCSSAVTRTGDEIEF